MKISARLRYLFVVFSLFIFFFLSIASSKTFAQTIPSNNLNPQETIQQGQYNTPVNNPDVPKNLHTWTQNVMVETMSAMICQLSGVDPINPKQGCLGIDSVTNKLGFIKPAQSDNSQPKIGGAIGFMNNMIVSLYTPPLHTGDYFNYLAQNFGVAKKSYAATGIDGFSRLNPLMGLWTAMRNIVYLFFVIVFVGIGLAIMLRIKIDPRTVMTIENQIPKIIIGLILVTFSFAIAGFLIDLMYVFIYLIYSIISGIPGAKVTDLDPGLMQGTTAIEAANSLAGSGGIFGITSDISGNLKNIIQSLMGINGCPDPGTCFNTSFNPLNFLQNIFSGSSGTHFNVIELLINIASGYGAVEVVMKILSASSFQAFTVDFGKIAGGVTAAAAGIASYGAFNFLLREIVPYLIVYMIIFVAILWALFRLWFQLLSAYVFILLDVILSPFFIITGVFPGGFGIGGWLRDIIGNLSVFPVTIGMFLMSKVIIDTLEQSGSNMFLPPLIGNPTPYTGSTNANPITSIIALGILLLTPQVVAMMKDAIKSPQFKYTASIGQAVGKGFGAVNVPSHAQKLGQYGYYAGHIGENPFLKPFTGLASHAVGIFKGGKGG